VFSAWGVPIILVLLIGWTVAGLVIRGRALSVDHAQYRAEIHHRNVMVYEEWQRAHCGIDTFDAMNGTDFEERLAVLFRSLGWEVAPTRTSGDFGADLVCIKSAETLVVQAKRSGSPVGVGAVQEVRAAESYYSANRSVVITNNTFTRSAKELAERNHVALWDRDRLIDELVATQEVSAVELPPPALPPPRSMRRLRSYFLIGAGGWRGRFSQDPLIGFRQWRHQRRTRPIGSNQRHRLPSRVGRYPYHRIIFDMLVGIRRCENCGKPLSRKRQRWCSKRCGEIGRRRFG
jgi:hypothetical protein